MDKALILCIIVLLIPIGITLLHTLCKELVDRIFKPAAYNNYSTEAYWRDSSKKTPTVRRKVLGRKHPPCATFFSKVNGQERQVDGSYEEKWLTAVEKWNWKIRRKKNE